MNEFRPAYGTMPVTAQTRLLLTAAEAYPVLERMFLDAEDRIVASFRVFDPSTRLRSAPARAVGATWFDLILHTLRRGIAFHLLLSDFDPIVQPEHHRATWSSLRQLWAAAELAGSGARLTVAPGLHPARISAVPRLMLWRRARGELIETRDRLNRAPPPERLARLRDMPGLHAWLAPGADGHMELQRNAPPVLYTTTHHQKIAVMDGRRLYIGGLDLNERRYDTPDHDRPGSETWHDIQIVTDGPVAADAERHVLAVPAIVEGTAQPPDVGASGLLTTCSAVRALPLVPMLSPLPVSDTLAQRLKLLIGQAQSSIYIETQFFRDRGIARAFARAAAANPRLTLLMVLPGAPEVIAFENRRKPDSHLGEYLQARCIRRVRAAFGNRAFFASPAQRVAQPGGGRDTLLGAPIIYVHAKLAIFDDAAMVVSSANLNGRSMAWDTEAGVHIADSSFVRACRDRALRHWLPDAVAADAAVPERTVDVVRDLALLNARLRPQDRRGLLLPHDVRPAAAFGHALPGVPDEMV